MEKGLAFFHFLKKLWLFHGDIVALHCGPYLARRPDILHHCCTALKLQWNQRLKTDSDFGLPHLVLTANLRQVRTTTATFKAYNMTSNKWLQTCWVLHAWSPSISLKHDCFSLWTMRLMVLLPLVTRDRTVKLCMRLIQWQNPPLVMSSAATNKMSLQRNLWMW